jgi:Mg2+ and Co2+ transporter CorA
MAYGTYVAVRWIVEIGDEFQPEYDALHEEVQDELLAMARKEVTMPRNVNDIIRRLSPARRKKVENRAGRLIAEEMTRQDLRRARKQTQVEVAKMLGITQDSVSRLEQRTDLLLSTLRNYVAALGGRLSLIAEFPDQDPVLLSGIADDEVKLVRRKNHKRLKIAA